MVRKEINSVKGKAYYVAQRAKYLNYAKEASATGDRVLSEYNLQYAEHFSRIIAEKFPQQLQDDAQDADPTQSDENQETETKRTEMPRKLPIRRKHFYKKPQLQEPSE